LQPHSGELTTGTGFLPMTPEYASPEQANVTTYSDIYSFGVLLYELLTGHLPYRLKAVPAIEIARIITETRPQLPLYPHDIYALTNRAEIYLLLGKFQEAASDLKHVLELDSQKKNPAASRAQMLSVLAAESLQKVKQQRSTSK